MTPLVFVTIGVILVFGPLSLLLTWFLWRWYREPEDQAAAIAEITQAIQGIDVEASRLYEVGLRFVGQGNRLMLMLALQMTTRDIAVVLLIVPTILFILGIAFPWSGQVILLAIDILLVSGVVVAGYLWWLRRA